MPKIQIRRGNLNEHDCWMRHRLAYNMGLWDFSYTYAVNTMDINQHIDGIKSFENHPVIPIGFPTEDMQAANKIYVDYASVTNVTYENLSYNGDVGPGSEQVAAGDHSHSNLPTDNQKAGLDTAQSPSAVNPFTVWSQFSLHSSRHTTTGQDRILDATSTTPGLMSVADKVKLDSL